MCILKEQALIQIEKIRRSPGNGGRNSVNWELSSEIEVQILKGFLGLSRIRFL